MHIRIALPEDVLKIKQLYQVVSCEEGGIARLEHEITEAYVGDFVSKGLNSGFILVTEHPQNPEELVAEIHAYKPGPAVFDHILSDLTIVVHPAFQQKKYGRTILTIFLEQIALNRPDIGRIELMVRESNHKAITFYQSLGFRIEGRFEMRIKTTQKTYEADIPMMWQNPNYEFDE
jgi:ribosomal protein S18 acetylase RimI-like enzyme